MNLILFQTLTFTGWLYMYSMIHNSQPHPESDRIRAITRCIIPVLMSWLISKKLQTKIPVYLSTLWLVFYFVTCFLTPGLVYSAYAGRSFSFSKIVALSLREWLITNPKHAFIRN